MRWLSLRETSALTGLSVQSCRKMFPVTKFGRAVRIWEADVVRYSRARVVNAALDVPELKQLFTDNGNAAMFIEHLKPDLGDDVLPCPEMTALLTSSLAAIRMEHPGWPPIDANGVFPPVLAWLKANLPMGGGAIGDKLRELIKAA